MSLSVLVCVLPARGHVSPTLAVVTDLLAAGHSVQVITGAGYRDRFTQAGAEVTVLAPDADFDDGDVDGSFPGRRGLSGIRLARHDLIEAFVRPMPSRWATVGSVLSRFPADVVLVDPLFLAGIPLVMTRPGGRPRVFVLGFLPVTLDPIAPPGALAWLREPVTAFAMHRALAPVQELADHLTRELTGQPLTTWFTQWVGMADGILQMTGPGFEYPRPHPPTPIHFVGPPTHSSSAEYPLPDWWDELDTDRPVIHLTQGTVANTNLGDVIEPALAALAHQDCLVVVSTGGGRMPERLPPNARAAPFLPYDDLLPRCDLMVTNGGYGGVNLALRHGTPLLVIGASEDKRAIAHRVTWSGVGLGIGRVAAGPGRISSAVRRILREPAFAAHAQRLARQIATCPGVVQTLPGLLGEAAGDQHRGHRRDGRHPD